MSLAHRVMAALGANAFGQAVSVCIQLFSLPLFLQHWDTSTYGAWLILSAIPSYLSMADVGMTATAGNHMTMELARGRVHAANVVFHSATAFMSLVCVGVACVVFPLIATAPMLGWIAWADRLPLAALSLAVLLTLFGGLADAALRATGRYALGTSIGNIARLLEWAGSIAGLVTTGTFTAVALGGLAGRCAGLAMLIALARRGDRRLTWGVREASWGEVANMARPAASFMVFPLANALNFQGVTLLVGHAFGPAIVAIFNSYRTLARVAVQLTGIFGHALWAEFSSLYGRHGTAGLHAFYRRSAWLGAGLAAATSVVLYLIAPILLRVWTHGAIPFDAPLLACMLAYAAVGGAWHVPRVLLMSTNRHVALAPCALVLAAAVLGLSALMARAWGIHGVSGAMLICEAAIALVTFHLVQRFLGPAVRGPVELAT